MMRYGGNGFVQSGAACAKVLPANTSVRNSERKRIANLMISSRLRLLIWRSAAMIQLHKSVRNNDDEFDGMSRERFPRAAAPGPNRERLSILDYRYWTS